MSCDHVKTPGFTAIICSRGRRYKCFACHLAGGYQCDWKVSKTKTCDRNICPEHAKEVAPNKHLCPEHQATYEEWKKRQAAKERA